ncbi:ZIP family plasma membrane transporter [Hepatospora eriocheir]|uniref:ZIP family plasma membrane transporter n=1 Tax=Hepatospora eriocheir TaxID=1081669 RepID=A0A1X0QKV9_9MICR|nr:ZIP family plasma membrane transporter [Hepatospora eriocheir]
MPENNEHLTFLYAAITIIGLLMVENMFVHCSHSHHHHDKEINTLEEAHHHEVIETEKNENELVEEDDFNQHHFESLKDLKNPFQIGILLGALSLHSLLEGLDNHCNSTPIATVGLFMHKMTDSLSAGLALSKGTMSKGTALKFLFAFCCVTPLFMCIGASIRTYIDKTFLEPLLKGLSLGSLLYVIFFENIATKLHGKSVTKKLLFTLIGLLLGSFFIIKTHGQH